MATAMPTNRYVDDVIPIRFSIEKISKDKKYKEKMKQEIAKDICALMNSNGGTVYLNLVSTTYTILASLTRAIEQSLKSRLGAQITELVKIFEDKQKKVIKICVNKARFLVTFKYNLYRPTPKQVEIIGNLPDVVKIMDTRIAKAAVEFGSHRKTFRKGQDCELEESEVIQFKNLKSASSKRVTLADRMTGKSNKFTYYVSAFANHRGGHFYYGIEDDGSVQGENTEETSEIEKKVKKSIQKMNWPDAIGQPKRGKHWEIFFEQVLDEKSNPIPSTFVIVIFIAPCSGGVFTEEPESYEMVEGKVERMSFTTWKERLQPVGLNKRKQEVPTTINRASLRPEAKKRCRETHEVLTKDINNGEWKSFRRRACEFEQVYPDNLEVKSVVLSRRVMANYRQGYVRKALIFLAKFQKCFFQAEEPLVFEVLFHISRIAVARVSGKTAESQDISTDALTKAEHIEPGICTAALYLIAASTFVNSQNDAVLSPDTLCIKALEHLEYVEDAPVARADRYHTAHITLAAYYLGYNLSGKVIKKVIDKESFQKAKASIMAVHQSVCDGNPLTKYREIWITLAQSMLYIRHSQFEPEKQSNFLNDAFQFAKKAENLAKDSGLVEMVCWAQTTLASCTEALILVKFIKITNEGKQSPGKIVETA